MVAERFLILATALLILVLALIPLACGGQGTQGKIAFTSYRDGNSEIYVMDADGENQPRLSKDPGLLHNSRRDPRRDKAAYS